MNQWRVCVWLTVGGLISWWVALEVWISRWKRGWTPPRCPHCRTRLDGLRRLNKHVCAGRRTPRDRSP